MYFRANPNDSWPGHGIAENEGPVSSPRLCAAWPLRPIRQSISGKAAAGVDLVDENSGLHPWIVVHDLPDFIDCAVKDAHSGNLAAVPDRANDGEDAFRPEREIAPAMLPDDLVRPSQCSSWSTVDSGVHSYIHWH